MNNEELAKDVKRREAQLADMKANEFPKDALKDSRERREKDIENLEASINIDKKKLGQ